MGFLTNSSFSTTFWSLALKIQNRVKHLRQINKVSNIQQQKCFHQQWNNPCLIFTSQYLAGIPGQTNQARDYSSTKNAKNETFTITIFISPAAKRPNGQGHWKFFRRNNIRDEIVLWSYALDVFNFPFFILNHREITLKCFYGKAWTSKLKMPHLSLRFPRISWCV